jgi:hypothetical protein
MRDSTSYADPGLKVRDTLPLATVFDSEVGPAAPLSLFLFFYLQRITRAEYRVPLVSPTSKSQQTLATAKFLTHFIISIAVLENSNVSLSRVTEKSNFSTLNVGLAGTGNRT